MENENKCPIFKNNKFWLILAFIVSAIFVIYSSIVLRGSYLDGSLAQVALLNNFSSGNHSFFIDFSHCRIVPVVLYQFPMWFSYFVLGLKSKYVLSMIFSASLFTLPIVFIWLHFLVCKRTKRWDVFVYNLALYPFIFLPNSIFAITETNSIVSLNLILLNYLVANIIYNKKDITIISISLLLLLSSHEYILMYGVVLYLISFYYAAKKENEPYTKAIKETIGLLAAVASTFVFIFIHSTPGDEAESLRFLGELIGVLPHLLELNSLITIASLLLIAFVLSKKDYIDKKIQISCSIIIFLALIHLFNTLDTSLVPMWEIHFRVFAVFVVPMIPVLVFVLDLIKKNLNDIQLSNITTIILMAIIAQTIWQINNTYWFDKNIKYMQKELAECNKPLYIADEQPELSSFFNSEKRRYIWYFSYAATSILFNKDYELKTLLVPTVVDDGGDKPYRDYLFKMDDNKIMIPTIAINIKNNYWDLTNVSNALDSYNKSHHIKSLNAK